MAMDPVLSGGEPLAGAAARLGPQPAADDRWKALTAEANAAFASGHLALARTTYMDALDEAERLFSLALEGRTSIPVPVIYNVSCHNLSEVARESGDKSAAECLLVRAYDKLLASAASPETPLQLRLDSTEHLKHALSLLVQELHRNGAPDDRVADYVERARKTALVVFHVARHAEIAGDGCTHCSVLRS
jgi:hypothetical protein